MLIKILAALSVILVLLALYVAVKIPTLVRIARTQLIQASPETLFPYINNPRRIQEWNPFADGTESKVTYTGPESGIGAQWAWEGSKSGAGQATITESEPDRRVGVRLDFKKPFNATNRGEYALSAQGSGTVVTWAIDETAFIPRAMSVFVSLDKLIGGEFEKGLSKLKTLTEPRR